MTSDESAVLDAFLQELMIYRGPLRLALESSLGKHEAQSIIEYLKALEAKGSYIGDPEIGKELGAFFVGLEEDLGFYVLTSYNSEIKLDMKEDGQIYPPDVTLYARPIFLYWPRAIEHTSSQLQGSSLPSYFTPWVHEFGHFLCYWLQERPIMVAMNILVGALAQRGVSLQNSSDLQGLSPKKVSPFVWELVRLLAQLSAVNEAMAVWWEEELLQAMEFEAGGYVAPKKTGNPYVAQIEACSTKKALDYIRQWERPEYYAEKLAKEFLNSFSRLVIDKWSFLDKQGAKAIEKQF